MGVALGVQDAVRLTSSLQQIRSGGLGCVLATLILYFDLLCRPHCVALPQVLDALCYDVGVGLADCADRGNCSLSLHYFCHAWVLACVGCGHTHACVR